MKRRDVLKVAAVGAAAATVGGAGCATVPTTSPNAAPDPRAAAAFLASLDEHLGLAEGATPIDGFVKAMKPGPRSPAVQAVIESNDEMFRRVLRTLFISQSFRDLPHETQLHPAVQERMTTHLDEIDGTVFALSDYLSAQTVAQRTQLRDVFRAKPQVTMQIAEQLDRHAAAAGMSKARRKQLRSMMTQTAFRLKTEAPGAVIDEYTAKVERLRGADGNSALAIALAEKMGQKAFWKYQKHLAQGVGSGPAPAQQQPPPPQPQQQRGIMPPGAMRPVASPVTQSPYGPPPEKTRGSGGVVRAGGYMMGIGAVVLGVSALLVDTSAAFLVGVTAGALLISLGFLTLIVGAVLLASD